MEEAVSKCLLKKFGRSVHSHHLTFLTPLIYSPTALGIAPVHGALLAPDKLLERPVYTCCLPSPPPISSSTHCFLTSVLRRTALTQATPSSAQRLRPGQAGRRTGWKRRKSPQTTIALDLALLPDGHLVSHLSPMPLASFLVWDEAFARNPSWEGTSDTGPQHPTPVKSLHSHGDALHTFPQDRLDPKTLDSGRPLRGGACPPRPPLLTDGLH
ncbi:uncharacterized protein LOC109455581 isoform X1 [Rhinolophus sinicus]|uniref:uncharacterized protein LOC109455581 isoform X1 n=1 Tax=Rhinolophus sinicus TaxID=89399 RepID=UPI003D7BFDA1